MKNTYTQYDFAQWFGGVQYMWIIDKTDTFLTIRWKITGQCIFYAFDNCRFPTPILPKNQRQRWRKCDFLQNIKLCTILSITITIWLVNYYLLLIHTYSSTWMEIKLHI